MKKSQSTWKPELTSENRKTETSIIERLLQTIKDQSCDNLKEINKLRKTPKYTKCFPNPYLYNVKYIPIDANAKKPHKASDKDLMRSLDLINGDGEILTDLTQESGEKYRYHFEEILSQKLDTISEFRQRVRNGIENHCLDKGMKPLVGNFNINDGITGILYAHNKYAKDIKGKDLFKNSYDSKILGKFSHKCVTQHILSKRQRFLFPMEKRYRASILAYKMIKMSKKGEDSIVYELIEVPAEVVTKKEDTYDQDSYLETDQLDDPMTDDDQESVEELFSKMGSEIDEADASTDADSDSEFNIDAILKEVSASTARKTSFAHSKNKYELAMKSKDGPEQLNEESKELYFRVRDSRGYDYSFAPVYKFFFVEFWTRKNDIKEKNFFKSMAKKLGQKVFNGKDEIMFLTSGGEAIAMLLKNCFVPYWPQTYREAGDDGVPNLNPTSDLFANFFYTISMTISFRIWVQFDPNTDYEEMVYERLTGAACAAKKKVMSSRILKGKRRLN